ncbi:MULTISPECIES: hypothetical protein [Pseudomonas]|uniref:Uncharacterized protein n=1 Tax=Pseudomonas nitroreducens TaxID=46680 RepID=A0A6G6JAI2_PSENT|nr:MULTISPECIES: hypothetical protein [Pseudomonas]MDU4255328.1 hypothetical protein [Pseudomonas sp.]QIE91481.1 hypothetical protein G5B91_34690 [Pseudomonas nitroreducens]
MANYLRLGRIALFAAAVGLGGCASPQLPKLDVDSIDTELDAYSCPAKLPPKELQDCLEAYHPKIDTQASRELRLLRAYLLLDSTAHYGARRFTAYSDAPADDANQLMGAIASSVEGLTVLESERTEPAGDSGSLFRSKVSYKVDKVDVFLRIVTTVDAATKPVVRGVTGMLFLNSTVDRIKKGAKLVRDLGVDKLYASAYRDGMVQLRYLQMANVPYDTARAEILARLNTSCLALAALAKRTEHSCGKTVVAAGAAAGAAATPVGVAL